MASKQSFTEKEEIPFQSLKQLRVSQSIENFQHKPLIELTNFCNDKGFEVVWTKDKKPRALLFHHGELVKKGEKQYDNEIDLQIDIYNQIYKKLKKL